MPRKPRVWYPGAMYHVTARGNRKNNLVRDQRDYQRYLHLLLKSKANTPFILHSYCLMPNHIHLIIETIDHPLSFIIFILIMQNILIGSTSILVTFFKIDIMQS
ncbi:transposase [Rossellomorea aquimaris]|uniref:transposase n=1 Tax=Rossellomorea aquimaris TaxID=189382 RepID=UPI0009EF5961|nr:transposase [Rossellomorea aquimaris]